MTFYFFSFSDFFSVDAMPLTQLDKILYEGEFLSTYHLDSWKCGLWTGKFYWPIPRNRQRIKEPKVPWYIENSTEVYLNVSA